MSQYLNSPVFIVFASITVVALGSTLANVWLRAKRSSLEAELKLEMIERGMTADEICQVVRARPGQEEVAHCGRGSRRARTDV